jgi:hypothetical protein
MPIQGRSARLGRFRDITFLAKGSSDGKMRIPSTAGPTPDAREGRARLGALALLAVVSAAAFGLAIVVRPSPVLPPDTAAPGVVLTAYLVALDARDCASAQSLSAPTWSARTDGGCGTWHVSLIAPPVQASREIRPGEVAFVAMLEVRGDNDFPMRNGPHEFACILDQQLGGAWRVASVGTGP